jgi:hypothetical protein
LFNLTTKAELLRDSKNIKSEFYSLKFSAIKGENFLMFPYKFVPVKKIGPDGVTLDELDFTKSNFCIETNAVLALNMNIAHEVLFSILGDGAFHDASRSTYGSIFSDSQVTILYKPMIDAYRDTLQVRWKDVKIWVYPDPTDEAHKAALGGRSYFEVPMLNFPYLYQFLFALTPQPTVREVNGANGGATVKSMSLPPNLFLSMERKAFVLINRAYFSDYLLYANKDETFATSVVLGSTKTVTNLDAELNSMSPTPLVTLQNFSVC